MKKYRIITAIQCGTLIGLLGGCIMVFYEFLKYFLEGPGFYSWKENLTVIIVFVVIIPVLARFYLNGRGFNYMQKVVTIFVGYFLCATVKSVILIFLHHGLDSHYRERIAEYKIQIAIESKEKLERELNAKITSSIDILEIKERELKNYQLGNLLLLPIRLTPLTIFLSFIFGLFLYKSKITDEVLR